MRKLLFFVGVSVLAVGLLGAKGITGHSVTEVPVGNIGISMVCLILLAFVFALFTFRVEKDVPAKKADVWDELARAEEEWQEKKRRGK